MMCNFFTFLWIVKFNSHENWKLSSSRYLILSYLSFVLKEIKFATLQLFLPTTISANKLSPCEKSKTLTDSL